MRPLPRFALWMLCMAYVLPGFIGREPWKNADISAFGYMSVLAGITPGEPAGHWLSPLLLGQPPEFEALLPYWLGAWAIQFAPAWMTPDLSVRLLYALMLAFTLWTCWSAVYQLARSTGAQPVAFAFGGEAGPKDYARAIADGGLLALIACLGLAQLSHETTPALAQLLFTALLMYGFAALPFSRLKATLAVCAGLAGLVLSGAPSMAMMLGLAGVLVLALAPHEPEGAPAAVPTRWLIGLLLATAAVMMLASMLDVWRWRLSAPSVDWRSWRNVSRLLLWFTWPAWPLVLWTLWRWRRQLQRPFQHRHLSLPVSFAAIAVMTTLLTPAADRSLLLALPAMAALAAFALPTFKRGLSALIDWFTLLFFSGWIITIWAVWLSLQTGVPAKPAANVARIIPGFEPVFSWVAFVLALLATLAWLWLVVWRTGRHRAAIWKSLVLPAGGTTLCWLLLTTLMLPSFDYARSYAPMMQIIGREIGPTTCLTTESLSRAQVAALQFHGRYVLKNADEAANCPWLLIAKDAVPGRMAINGLNGWTLQATVRRPSDSNEVLSIYRRDP